MTGWVLELIHTATLDTTQTGLFCRAAQCDRRTHSDAERALIGPTQFTPPDTTQTGPSCLVWRSGVVSGTTVRALVLGRFSQKIELKDNAKK